MKQLLALLLIMTMSLVTGCGRKTPPMPPQAVIATAITDLRGQLDDQAVTLTWSRPRLSVNGARIDTIRSFIVYKARIPVADYCSGCPVVFDDEFEVDAQDSESSNQITFRDPELDPGYHYVYMVRTSSGWRILSEDSNRISFQRQHALLPPADLQIDSGDSNLTLSWSPVSPRPDDPPLSGLKYQIYRSLDNRNFSPLGLPMSGLTFIDPAVTNGRTYFYHIRAVLAEQGIIILGRASSTAIGMPVDMTAPAPPGNVITIVRPSGIQLHWQISPSTDVAGYYIYRHGQEGTWQRIATTSAGAITYADDSDLPAGVYSYRITAFDKSIRRNESEPTQPVSYTKP